MKTNASPLYTLFAGFAFALAFAIPRAAYAFEWAPKGLVELVVPSGPGSGMDVATRTIKHLLDAEKLLSGTSVVINKPGAGGTIAYQYLNQRNAFNLALASPSLVTNKMMGIGDVDARDITPVAMLFSENIVFMVRADSSIQDGKALIARLKQDPSTLTFGIATALGGANHIAAASLLKGAGVNVKAPVNVLYKAGSAALVGLLAGEVDVVPVATLVSLPQVTAGKVRVVAISAPQRLSGPYAAVPTLIELGIQSDYTSWRMLVAPRGANVADVRAAADALKSMVALPEWRVQLERNFWIGRYLGPEDTRRFLDEQHEMHRALLSQLGLVK